MTTGTFNNREIATAIWAIAILLLALQKANIRQSFTKLLRAFFRFKVLLIVCLMVLYTAATVTLLAFVGLWKIALLKNTIMWFCISAMAMMMRFATSDKVESIFHKVLIDNIKVVILLEFLVNTYTFSLPVELIILPILALIAMFDAVASLDRKYSAVARLTKGMQVVIGLMILVIALSRAISDLRNLQNFDTFRSIAMAPLLSVMFTPFLYIMVLVFKYEDLFLWLDFVIGKEKVLKRYARHRIMMHAGFSLRKLQQIRKDHGFDLMNIQTETDIDRLFETKADH